MKIKGFTISEISIGMILGSLIVTFGLTYLTMLNHSTLLQLNSYDKLHEFHLFNTIITNEFKHHEPQVLPNSIKFLKHGSPEVISLLTFYQDSIVFDSKTHHQFQLKGHINNETSDSKVLLKIVFPELPNTPELVYIKNTNKGFLLNTTDGKN